MLVLRLPGPRLAPSLLVLAVGCSTVLAGLQQDIESLVSAAGLGPGQVSVSVRDCPSDRTLAAIEGNARRIPASNMKLLSSGTAALVLGADFRFETRLVHRGNDLVVIGDGDPALGDPELLAQMVFQGSRPPSSVDLVDLWAAAVTNRGVRHVDDLIVDDRVFDRVHTHPEWPESQLWKGYCAQISGVAFHRNVVHLRPVPSVGRVDVSDVRPPFPGVEIANELKVGQPGKDKHTVGAGRKTGTNRITLRGTVPEPTITPIAVTVDDVPLQFGLLLADRLRRHGVTVGRVRLARSDEPPSHGIEVAPPIVTPLPTVLAWCNHESLNTYAEALLKRAAHETTGRPGSWTDGNRVITRTVETIAGPSTTLHVADGSGMSRANRASTDQFTRWLCGFDEGVPDQKAFIESLPDSKEGTLRGRWKAGQLHGATLRAKSGYLSGVWSLSGYLDSADGRRLALSIIVNKSRGSATAKPVINQIVSAIAKHLAKPGN